MGLIVGYTGRRLTFVFLTMIIVGTGPLRAAAGATLEAQRKWYEQAKVALDEDDRRAFRRLRRKLDDYALAPYLDFREFLADVDQRSPRDFEAFVGRYRTLPFLGTLRSRYLLQRADAGRWGDILAIQTASPRDQALRCVYFRAHLEAGDRAKAFEGAEALWRSGRSIDDRCDPLFEAWASAGRRSDAQVLDRMLLAFSAGNGGLLRFLNDLLSDSARSSGNRALELYRDPRGVGAFAKASKVTDFNKTLAKHALRRLVRKDADAAVAQFDKVVAGQHLSEDDGQALADSVASRLMDEDRSELVRWRDSKLRTSQSVRRLESRIRLALRQARWAEAQTWIRRLPQAAQKSIRWTFWRGRLALRLGNRSAGREILASITGRHSFYSAAAATLLDRKIEYAEVAIPKNPPSVAAYRKALERIQELIALDKIADAKREWRGVLAQAGDRDTKRALAIYAYKNDWYHLTVQATIAGQLWDNIRLRFPVAYKWWFEFFERERELPASMMLAVARLESALDSRAESRARARGLLQVLPSTAREVARRLRFRYKGAQTLFDPGVNIRLGSSYLKSMLQRCDGNRIFAFASYNAGYTRTKRWRAATDGRLDVYAFVEQIPFNETRGYVQNALMFEVYYARLLGKSVPLFHSAELKAKY